MRHSKCRHRRRDAWTKNTPAKKYIEANLLNNSCLIPESTYVLLQNLGLLSKMKFRQEWNPSFWHHNIKENFVQDLYRNNWLSGEHLVKLTKSLWSPLSTYHYKTVSKVCLQCFSFFFLPVQIPSLQVVQSSSHKKTTPAFLTQKIENT